MKRILIVEDDIYIRECLVDLLEGEGYEVLTAADGQIGIDLLKKDPAIDLILLDLMMPNKDGFEFKSEQGNDPRLSHIPVVIMSADGNVSEKKAKVGAKEYLKKPVDLEKLLQTVSRYCL